jgi:hypothetical protein
MHSGEWRNRKQCVDWFSAWTSTNGGNAKVDTTAPGFGSWLEIKSHNWVQRVVS